MNGTYRCIIVDDDESYKKVQTKLWAKTMWRLVGNKFTTSTLKDFSVGQTYSIVISGNTMTMTGTEGQGVTVYKRL